MSASPAREPKVREILNVLRRRGLLDDLDEAVFERTLEAARRYVQGRLSTIEWIRVLHELELMQGVSLLRSEPNRALAQRPLWVATVANRNSAKRGRSMD
jgi:hypothetical protein